MDYRDSARLRLAMYHATAVYPGPVGKFLAKELMAIEQVGFAFVRGSLLHDVVEQIIAKKENRE